MRPLFFLLFLMFATPSFANEKELTGSFSNEAQGFETVSVVVFNDGIVCFFCSIGGLYGEWTFDESSSRLSMKFIMDLENLRTETMELRFDQSSRTYGMIRPDEDDPRNTPPYEMRFITEEIPQELIRSVKNFFEKVKKNREILAKHREEMERLERERPEYEQALAQIKENPRSVLSMEFHFPKLAPHTRAFETILDDQNFNFSENFLIELLEQFPENNPYIRTKIFGRHELQPATLTKFYPKALEWGKRSPYILVNIANHPNTPMEIIRDLAERGIPLIHSNPAKDRLKKIDRELEKNNK